MTAPNVPVRMLTLRTPKDCVAVAALSQIGEATCIEIRVDEYWLVNEPSAVVESQLRATAEQMFAAGATHVHTWTDYETREQVFCYVRRA